LWVEVAQPGEHFLGTQELDLALKIRCLRVVRLSIAQGRGHGIRQRKRAESSGQTGDARPCQAVLRGQLATRLPRHAHYRVFEVGIRVGIKGLPELTESQLGRLEDEIRRERQRRASSAGGVGASRVQKGASPPLTEVLEYRPYEDGYLQLELRRYVRLDGSARERGPYWYFQYHEGGKRKKLYLGKTNDPESMLTVKRAKP
jgi:hypothetical protein